MFLATTASLSMDIMLNLLLYLSLQRESMVQRHFLSRYFNDLFCSYFYGTLLLIIKCFLSEPVSRNLEFDIGSISFKLVVKKTLRYSIAITNILQKYFILLIQVYKSH